MNTMISIEETMQRLDLKRSKLYRLLQKHRIRPSKLGSRAFLTRYQVGRVKLLLTSHSGRPESVT